MKLIAVAIVSLLQARSASGFDLPIPSLRNGGGTSSASRTLVVRPSSSSSSPPGDDVNGVGKDREGQDQRFSSFASSLLDQPGRADAAASSRSTGGGSRRPESSKANPYSSSSNNDGSALWKRDLDELMDISTSNQRRQMLLQRLVTSNQDIRSSVEQALKDRKVRKMVSAAGASQK
jgi:hypothetical protein